MCVRASVRSLDLQLKGIGHNGHTYYLIVRKFLEANNGQNNVRL